MIGRNFPSRLWMRIDSWQQITVQICDAICSQCCLTWATHNYMTTVNQVAARKHKLFFSATSKWFFLSVVKSPSAYLVLFRCNCVWPYQPAECGLNTCFLVCPCIMQPMFINMFLCCCWASCIMHPCVFWYLNFPLRPSFHVIFLYNPSVPAAAKAIYNTAVWFYVCTSWCPLCPLPMQTISMKPYMP